MAFKIVFKSSTYKATSLPLFSKLQKFTNEDFMSPNLLIFKLHAVILNSMLLNWIPSADLIKRRVISSQIEVKWQRISQLNLKYFFVCVLADKKSSLYWQFQIFSSSSRGGLNFLCSDIKTIIKYRNINDIMNAMSRYFEPIPYANISRIFNTKWIKLTIMKGRTQWRFF